MILLWSLLGCGGPGGDAAGPAIGPSGDSGRPVGDCSDHLQAPTGQTAELADHRYAWLEGRGRSDTLGYSVACSDELGAPLQRAWAAGAPEFSDGEDAIAGWAFVIAGDAVGEQTEETARLVMRGTETVDAVGTAVALAPWPQGGGSLFAGAWTSGRVETSAGAVWVASIPASHQWVEHDDLTALLPGTERQEAVYRALPLGDIDGDLLTDFAVGHTYGGAPTEDNDGFISIHLGKDIEGQTLVDEAVHTFDDDGHHNLAGRSMWAGDINDDGHVDLIHGEPDRGGFTAEDSRVAIRLGPLLGGERDQDLVADVELLAPAADQLGVFGVRGDVGDVNDDGVDDVVIADVSVPIDGDDYAGAAYVFFGPLARGTSILADDADLILEGYAAWGQFGSPVIADHDGDGVNDLVVANKVRSGVGCGGRLHLFRGPLSPGRVSALEADLVYDGEHAGLGNAMAACDLDGDGDDELVVGQPGYSSGGLAGRGRVQVIEGWDFSP